nr:M20/M25/M40 family metallo-hydrolase [Pirellula sp.]
DPDKVPNRILLTIHYDTVYGLQDPFQKCTRLDGNRMRGPGVIDAKGGLIVLRYAALAAKEFLTGSPLQFSVVLTPDEEIGSPASSQLWKEIHDQFRFALLFEPAMADGCLVSHRKGTGTFVFCVHGRSAHSGRNFDAGRNAIVHAAAIACELHQLNGQREQVTVNVGRIRGGNAVNVVPDLTTVRVNVRVSSREDQDWIESQRLRCSNLFRSTTGPMKAIAFMWTVASTPHRKRSSHRSNNGCGGWRKKLSASTKLFDGRDQVAQAMETNCKPWGYPTSIPLARKVTVSIVIRNGLISRVSLAKPAWCFSFWLVIPRACAPIASPSFKTNSVQRTIPNVVDLAKRSSSTGKFGNFHYIV